MKKINQIHQITNYHYLNLYELDALDNKNNSLSYYIASRAQHTEELKLKTKQNNPDGVLIYSLYGEKQDKVVLIRQYRYSIDGYIYEFPAGLIENGENYQIAAKRELKEETGLDLEVIEVDNMYTKPFFTTIGMTDESCATVYGYAYGTPSTQSQEDSEEIEIILADKQEVRRILKEENVAIMCAYMLIHFLNSEDDHPFSFLK